MATSQSAAKIFSAAKLLANATRPTNVTSHEARLSVSEKSIVQTIFLATFFAVNAGKQIPNKVWCRHPKRPAFLRYSTGRMTKSRAS
jgi:hypothetical protein